MYRLFGLKSFRGSACQYVAASTRAQHVAAVEGHLLPIDALLLACFLLNLIYWLKCMSCCISFGPGSRFTSALALDMRTKTTKERDGAVGGTFSAAPLLVNTRASGPPVPVFVDKSGGRGRNCCGRECMMTQT